jgi:hypothetical protein
MKIAIHQPNFLPWSGYFYKMAQAARFVLLDSVQYSKGSFTNRVLIKSNRGAPIWLSVPVEREFGKVISQIKINEERDWRAKHLKTLKQFYGKAAYFKTYFPALEEIYAKRHVKLAALNADLIFWLRRMLDIEAEIHFASRLGASGSSTDLLVDICKKLEATQYLSGHGGVKYQDEAVFQRWNLEVVYSDFVPPVYRQLWGDFVSKLSVIDLLFNEGPNSRQILLGKKLCQRQDC